jgi:hypothetical protein
VFCSPAAQFGAVLMGLEVEGSAEPAVYSYCSASIASCLASTVRLVLLDGPVESAAEHCRLLLCAPRGKPVRTAAYSSRTTLLNPSSLGHVHSLMLYHEF